MHVSAGVNTACDKMALYSKIETERGSLAMPESPKPPRTCQMDCQAEFSYVRLAFPLPHCSRAHYYC